MSQGQKERKRNASKEEKLAAPGFLNLLTGIQKSTWRHVPQKQRQEVAMRLWEVVEEGTRMGFVDWS